tara:strand:+ start:409 stop:543 length:135 start_codon:yes stop_codon:yes gene_type:complete
VEDVLFNFKENATIASKNNVSIIEFRVTGGCSRMIKNLSIKKEN